MILKRTILKNLKKQLKRNNLIKELFDNDKDNMFWFNMIKE